MHCPKCQQNFEKGSRRFCPTDGARLVFDTDEAEAQKSGGIFANLVPKIETHQKLDERLPELPRLVVTEPAVAAVTPKPVTKPSEDVLFEFDDMGPVPDKSHSIPKPQSSISAEPPPAPRKVNPNDIPSGHVNLDDSYRPVLFAAEVDEENPDSFVGRLVKGRYRVTEFLGDDETGLAYLADDKILDAKKVLVRILLDSESDEIMDSILGEERVSLSHFSHPNIARLIDSGQFTNGTTFLISEFVDALSVADILAIHGNFNEVRAARIVRQTASGLNEAHQEGIIHRDIRPDSLVINPLDDDTEQAKLVNFGVSNGEPTQQNFAYKAPEVLDGRIPTTASDIYSLAVVAYEMITGRMPFAGDRSKDIVQSQYGGLTTLPTDIMPGLPKAVDGVLVKALSFNGGDRFPKARDFGDAFYAALAETPSLAAADKVEVPAATIEEKYVVLEPLAAAPPVVESAKPSPSPDLATVPDKPRLIEPTWKNRSPEPPQERNKSSRVIIAIGLVALLGLLIAGTYYLYNRPAGVENAAQNGQNSSDANTIEAPSPIFSNTEMPPFPRTVEQQPNTNFYQNTKQNLRGDLLLNFVGFTMYYPKDWKVNGPQAGTSPNARGKFIDISKLTPDGRMKEQMLVSYYPSKGTYTTDAVKFPQMVKEANETLKKILPGYQMVTEGEIKLNGDWRAYELKFQGGGTSPTGEKLVVWGRRLFIPAARPGIRNGFEITMLATSYADDVRGVDDVGVRGELAPILYSFEPSQNF